MLSISHFSLSSKPRLQIKSCTKGERHVVMGSPVKICNIKYKGYSLLHPSQKKNPILRTDRTKVGKLLICCLDTAIAACV